MPRMKMLAPVMISVAAVGVMASQRGAPPKPPVQNPVVVQFMIDGIDSNTVRTAVASGATTLGALLKEGVTVDTYYCTSPAPRLQLPDGSTPWGGSTSSNVAMHTGTHLFESRNIDDIFLSARRAGIVSVFAGGSRNYAIFKDATHLYYGGDELTDEIVVDRGLQHLTKDNARLLRLHLQHIRNAWRGPSDTTESEVGLRSVFRQYGRSAAGEADRRLEKCGSVGEDLHHPRIRSRHGPDERERPSPVSAVVVADVHGVLRTGSEARRANSLRRRAGRGGDDQLLSRTAASPRSPG